MATVKKLNWKLTLSNLIQKIDEWYKFRAALRYIATNGDCLCGSYNPDDWEYSLPRNKKSEHKSHVNYCSGVIAAKALGWIK